MNISIFPKDVSRYILSFIDKKHISLCCKTYWHNTYNNVHNKNKESFVRHMIRNDNYFIFKQYLSHNYKIFVKSKKYSYKNKYFSCYLDLINYLSLRIYNSQNCYKEIISIQESKNSIRKKKFKKVKTKITKWSN